MKTRLRRRRGEAKGGMLVFLMRYANALITLAAAAGIVAAAVNHFATAADVEQKFSTLQMQFEISTQQTRKERIEDELFRLRNEPRTAGRQAQIKRFESQLQDVNARLRELQKPRGK